MKRALLTLGLLTAVGVTTAFAEGTIDAKLQCQIEYGSQSEMSAACKEGVDLAKKTAGTQEDATRSCTASRENGARISACEQGVAFYGRFSGQVRSTDKSSFSYTWQQPKTGMSVDVGDYQASVGNQKAVDDCMRAFEGSANPPSCMGGITVQPQAPAPMQGARPR